LPSFLLKAYLILGPKAIWPVGVFLAKKYYVP
jgi:hypothetical protein